MDRCEVMLLMSSSRNAKEWNANCEKVKAAFDGKYPDFWFECVISSGLMDMTLGKGASGIQVRRG